MVELSPSGPGVSCGPPVETAAGAASASCDGATTAQEAQVARDASEADHPRDRCPFVHQPANASTHLSKSHQFGIETRGQ